MLIPQDGAAAPGAPDLIAMPEPLDAAAPLDLSSLLETGPEVIIPQGDEIPSESSIGDAMLSADLFFTEDAESPVVVGGDEDAAEAAPLAGLATFLSREEPLTWVFAGARLNHDAAFGDGRLAGEWFAEEWRAESGRMTDLVIDSSWPECTLATLKQHLRSRVTRHRPDIACLFLDHSDAAAGLEELSHFERRLMAVLSMLGEIGTQVILLQPGYDPETAQIDVEVYAEAVRGIARERGVVHLVLPDPVPQPARARTPNSPARSAALFLCREARRVAT